MTCTRNLGVVEHLGFVHCRFLPISAIRQTNNQEQP